MATHRGLAIVLAILLTLTIAAASQFKVGGSGQWTSPNPNSMSYNDWAERTRFQVGDTLCKHFRLALDHRLRLFIGLSTNLVFKVRFPFNYIFPRCFYCYIQVHI